MGRLHLQDHNAAIAIVILPAFIGCVLWSTTVGPKWQLEPRTRGVLAGTLFLLSLSDLLDDKMRQHGYFSADCDPAHPLM